MTHKTINVSEEVYLNLFVLKKRNESFSDLFLRLTKREKPKLSGFYGKWKRSNKKEERIFKNINVLGAIGKLINNKMKILDKLF